MTLINSRITLLTVLSLLLFGFTTCKKDNPTISNTPIEIFDIFWNDFDRTYPYFIHKQIDWDSLYNVYVSHINNNITRDSLFRVLGELTLELRDIHVFLGSSYGDYHYSKKEDYPENPPINAYGYLSDVNINNSKCVFGNIKNTNFAYLQIKSFTGQEALFSQAVSSLDTIKNRDGLVIDIRHNGGGNELNGRAFAGRFIKNDTVYKYTRVRDGSSWDDFTSWNASILPSNSYLAYEGKIVLLTNRSVYSSAELFTLMMKSFPELIIVGDTTGGATANPSKKQLSNGWEYYVSTWQAASTNFDLIEDQGIAPDYYVLMTDSSIENGKDLILEKAIEILDLSMK